MKRLIITVVLLLMAACTSVPTNTKTENTKARYIFSDKNGLYGLLDENGKEITPAEYDAVEAFCQGLARVRKGEQRFIIDRSGKTVFEIKTEWRYVKEVNFIDREFYYWGLMSFYKTNGWENRHSLEKRFFPYIEMFFKNNPQSLFK